MPRMTKRYFASPDGLNSDRQHIFDPATDKSLCGRVAFLIGPDPDQCVEVKGDEQFQVSRWRNSGDCAPCWRKAGMTNAPPAKPKKVAVG